MSMFTTFLQADWVERAGWTLLHSLWQIGLIAIAYTLAAAVLRNRSANARYLLGCVTLSAMLALPLGTYVFLLRGAAEENASVELRSTVAMVRAEMKPPIPAPVPSASPSSSSAPLSIPRHVGPGNLKASASVPMETAVPPVEAETVAIESAPKDGFSTVRGYLPWATAAWLFGVMLLSLRPFWGWLHIRRLKRRGHVPLSDKLLSVGRRVAGRLRIRRAVQFAQSTLVEVPTVIGCFRPMILLPASAVTGLSTDQIELILAHELAHVRRHDWIVNLAQTVIEALLFYHPAMWWLSCQIRKERENCCDDMAVALGGSRTTYVQALARLEEQRAAAPAVVLAATGGALLTRVRRLLGKPTNDCGYRHAAAWLAGLITIGFVAATLAMSPVEKDQYFTIEKNHVQNGESCGLFKTEKTGACAGGGNHLRIALQEKTGWSWWRSSGHLVLSRRAKDLLKSEYIFLAHFDTDVDTGKKTKEGAYRILVKRNGVVIQANDELGFEKAAHRFAALMEKDGRNWRVPVGTYRSHEEDESESLDEESPFVSAYKGPCDVAASADGKRLYVAEKDARAMAVVDMSGGEVLQTIALPGEPTGVCLSPNDNSVYVTCGVADGLLCVVDLSSGKVTAKIPVGHSPRGPSISRDGKTAYVCNRFDNHVSVVDLTAKKEIARVKVLREPFDSAITPDGKTLLVTNHLPIDPADSNDVACEISCIDTATLRSKRIRLRNGATNLRGVCVSPDGKYAYAVGVLARYQMPRTQLERGWAVTSTLVIIDAKKREYVNTVLLDDVDLGAADPYGVATSADGSTVYVSHAGTHEISVIDAPAVLDKLRERADNPKPNGPTVNDVPNDLAFLDGSRQRITLDGLGPRGVAVVGNRAYCAMYFSDRLGGVAVVSKAAPMPAIPLGPKPVMTERRLGELYFQDATRCFQQWLSCATCHPDGRTDGLNWDMMSDGLGNPKGSASMLLAHDTPPVLTSGKYSDAATAVRKGFVHVLFSARPEEEALAVDAYLKSLVPVPSPHLVGGRLSEAARHGKTLFESDRLGCTTCHPAPLYTDLKMHDVGTRGQYDRRDTFDTPTLIETWRTGPYLHDGRYVTMKEVFTKGNHGEASDKLTEAEIDDLTQFVLSLSDAPSREDISRSVTAESSETVDREEVPPEVASVDNPLNLDDAKLITLYHTGKAFRNAAWECAEHYRRHGRMPEEVSQDDPFAVGGKVPFAPGGKLRVVLSDEMPGLVQLWSVGPDGDWDGGRQIDSTKTPLDGDLGVEMNRDTRAPREYLADDTMVGLLEGKRLSHYLAVKGPKLPKPELKDDGLKWGPVVDGLQLAVELPKKEAFYQGEPIDVRFRVRNAADYAIKIGLTVGLHRDMDRQHVFIHDERGNRLEGSSVDLLGRTGIKHQTLKPGETAVYDSGDLALVAPGRRPANWPVAHHAEAGPGLYTVRFKQTMATSGNDPREWAGELETAPVTIRIANPPAFAIHRVAAYTERSGSSGATQTYGFRDEGNQPEEYNAARLKKHHLDDLVLDGVPLVTEQGILGYDWARHVLRLTPEAHAQLIESIKPQAWGIPFVVQVAGQPIYQGTFRAAVSEYSKAMPAVLLDTRDVNGPHDIRIESPAFGQRDAASVDPRGDNRIRQALQEAGRLLDTRSVETLEVPTDKRTVAARHILDSLKQEVVEISRDFPQLAGAKAIEVTPSEWRFEYDCRYMGKRGFENTGPFPVAIGLRVITAEQFEHDVSRKAMQYPSYRWTYLGMVGWTTLHTTDDIPGGLVSKLQDALSRAVRQFGPLNREALAEQLPQEIQQKRDQLLAEADKTIRHGIRQLAEQYPWLKEGFPWENMQGSSAPGRLGIHLRRQQSGKGRTDDQPFPASEAFGILVLVTPPADEIGQLATGPLYPTLGLEGQVGVGAADPKLDAALKKLVKDALARLAEVEQRAAGTSKTPVKRVVPEIDSAPPRPQSIGATQPLIKMPQIETTWQDEAALGVSVQLTDALAHWERSDRPLPGLRLTYKASNNSRYRLHLPENGLYHQIEVDGQWYEWFDPRLAAKKEKSYDMFVSQASVLLDFEPGSWREAMRIDIAGGWFAVPKGMDTAREYQRRRAVGIGSADFKDHGPELALSSGKHRVRIAVFCPSARAPYHGVVRVVSNAVEVDIKPLAEEVAPDRLTIDLIRAEGYLEGESSYWIGHEQLDANALRERVALAMKNSPDLALVIRADGNVLHKQTAELMTLLEEAGGKKTSLSVLPPMSVFVISPGEGRDGMVRGKVIAPEQADEKTIYTVTLDHEQWTNQLGELPNLQVTAGETFEFRNVPAGKCILDAFDITSPRNSLVAEDLTRVDLLAKSKQTVEVELRFQDRQASSPWGPAVEGIQCRIRPKKPTWPQGTLPKFFADLRNNGQQERKIALEHESWEFEIDAKWHKIDFGVSGDRRYLPLGPGQEQSDLDVWVLSDGSLPRKLRALEPGKHTIRIARLFHEGPFENRLRVVSGAIEIEVVADTEESVEDPAPNEGFIERTMSFDFTSDQSHLDLDTGRYGKDQPGKDLISAMGESDMRVRHGLDMVAIGVDASRWDSPAEEILAAVAEAKPQQLARLGGPESRRTFFFKTREGGTGVLRIVSVEDNPGEVTIRYRLVPRSDSRAAEQPGQPQTPARTEAKETRERVRLARGQVNVARPMDSDSRSRFLEIERIARLSDDEQGEELSRLYTDLAPRYMNPMIEGLISSYRDNILDGTKFGGGPGGDHTTRWAGQLADAAGELSPEEVADKLEIGLWLNAAARARAIQIFKKHPEATAALIRADLDAKKKDAAKKDTVNRAASTIQSVGLLEFTDALLDAVLRDDATSEPARRALVFMRGAPIKQRLLEEVKKNPRLLIRCGGLFQGPLAGQPAEPTLLALMNSPDVEIRYGAVYAVYECSDPKLAPYAVKFATEKDQRFRKAAAYFAANLPRGSFLEVREELLPLLTDRDEEVRRHALRAFAKQKDLAAGDVILGLLKQDDVATGHKVTVMQAMSALTGIHFNYYMHEWGPEHKDNQEAITKFEAWLKKAKDDHATTSITGRVIGIDGKLAVGYRVTALPDAWSTMSGLMPSTKTDEQGEFTFHKLPDGACDVAVTSTPRTNQPNIRIEGVLLKKGKPVYVELSLEAKYRLSGLVTNQADEPQADRNILAIWKDPAGKERYTSNTKTDAEGRYRFAVPFATAQEILVNDGSSARDLKHTYAKEGIEDVGLPTSRPRMRR